MKHTGKALLVFATILSATLFTEANHSPFNRNSTDSHILKRLKDIYTVDTVNISMESISCADSLLNDTICADSSMDNSTINNDFDIFSTLKNSNNFTIECSDAIQNLVDKHILQNRKDNCVTGYRIQILSKNSSSVDMETLVGIRDKFEAEHPDLVAYLQYFDPEFKIRIGNFKNRLECLPVLKMLQEEFPDHIL